MIIFGNSSLKASKIHLKLLSKTIFHSSRIKGLELLKLLRNKILVELECVNWNGNVLL